MTVAAVIIVGPDDALADAVGRTAVRRIVDSAWAGGAMPIVVVARDAKGEIQRVLDGSPAILVDAPGGDPSDDRAAGIERARERVGDTAAVLLWPVSMTWVDPETVTSLIEAHGVRPQRTLRAAYAGVAGWPVLVALDAVDAFADAPASGSHPDALLEGLEDWDVLDLGDPGAIHGIEVTMDALPAYEGPGGPVGGPAPEWGAAAADTPD